MSNFKSIKQAVNKQSKLMSECTLYTVQIPDRDTLVNIYLDSFSDQIERQEHNCNCCKSFIRQWGNIISIKAGKIITIWDGKAEEPYAQAAKALQEFVSQQPIEGLFLTDQEKLGTDYNIAKATLIKWEHFYAQTPIKFVRSDYASVISEHNGVVGVFKRSLDELTQDSIDTVLELIAQNSLYRGLDYKDRLEMFDIHKKAYARLTSPRDKELYVWQHAARHLAIRNDAIGTLLVNLSEGMELDTAVRKYEAVVAPANYKRPTALVTPRMVEDAKATLQDLNLLTALNRRYAVESDIPVQHVLFVDRTFQKPKDVFAQISEETINANKLSKVEEITLDNFIAEVLPTAKEIEFILENKHTSNFMALTAAEDKSAERLFKWESDLAWAYHGNVTDSMKERVKIAGGRLEGALCCRLAWDYTDDLDFHMTEPNGHKIYYYNLRKKSPCGGILDTDANGMDGPREFPIENIVYETTNKMLEGIYELQVNNYSRNSDGIGFSVEIEFDGNVHTFEYGKALRNNETVTVAKIAYSKKDGFSIIESINGNSKCLSKEVWGIGTNKLHKVRMITRSPNYMDNNATGNKHVFFILEGAKSPEPVRGFFNEYLKNELHQHRKVLEIVGNKMLVPQQDQQLAGVGFSTTQRNSFTVKVKGSFTRFLKVTV